MAAESKLKEDYLRVHNVCMRRIKHKVALAPGKGKMALFLEQKAMLTILLQHPKSVTLLRTKNGKLSRNVWAMSVGK